MLTGSEEENVLPAVLPPPPGRCHSSGLKVLVYLGDVQHDALPVGPVRPHQLLHVLQEEERTATLHQSKGCQRLTSLLLDLEPRSNFIDTTVVNSLGFSQFFD